MTDNDRFFGEKNGSLNLGQMRQNWTQNHVFFCSLLFLPMTYNDSLEQCLTSSGGKIHDKKKLGLKFWLKWPKSDPKLGFWPFFHVWCISFS